MRSALLAVAAFVLVSCSAPCPTAPLKKGPDVKANDMQQWSCPTSNGVVIRTGYSAPWEGCEPYYPQ